MVGHPLIPGRYVKGFEYSDCFVDDARLVISVERDATSAAAFYRSALRTDPKNNELLDRAFIASVADGDIVHFRFNV